MIAGPCYCVIINLNWSLSRKDLCIVYCLQLLSAFWPMSFPSISRIYNTCHGIKVYIRHKKRVRILFYGCCTTTVGLKTHIKILLACLYLNRTNLRICAEGNTQRLIPVSCLIVTLEIIHLADRQRSDYIIFPWQFLYFLPEPHGQGSFLLILGSLLTIGVCGVLSLVSVCAAAACWR